MKREKLLKKEDALTGIGEEKPGRETPRDQGSDRVSFTLAYSDTDRVNYRP